MSAKNFIPKEEIQRIENHTDIVILIGEYVTLKTSGKNFMGLCPFHQEKTPSFVVSPVKQNYHCYGCGVHGNAIRFLMEIEKYSFLETLEFLARRAGLSIQWKNQLPFSVKKVDELDHCMKLAAQFYQKQLFDKPPLLIQEYLQKRNITSSSINEFQLGFVSEDWNSLYDHLLQKKIPIEIQEKCGLIKSNQKDTFYDFLRGRLIFPIRNIKGKYIGFAGRSLHEQNLPKYLNSPETELYKKNSVFYGIFEGQQTIRKKNQIILVEGYLDVIRLHEKGWKQAVATCGTALTMEHLKVLQRMHIEEIIFLFDGDKAGKKAAVKASELCLAEGQKSSVVLLPDSLDPDEYFQHYKEQDFTNLLAKPKDSLQFLFQAATENNNITGIEEQKKIIEHFKELYATMKDTLSKELLLTNLSRYFSLDKKLIKQKYMAIQTHETFKKNIIHENKLNISRLKQIQQQHRLEVQILQYMLLNPFLISEATQYLAPEEFSEPMLQMIFFRMIQLEPNDYLNLEPLDFATIFIEEKEIIMYLIQSVSKHILDNPNFTKTAIIKKFETMIHNLKKEKINHALFSQKMNERDFFEKRNQELLKIRHLNHFL